jgi:hypothetical protein
MPHASVHEIHAQLDAAENTPVGERRDLTIAWKTMNHFEMV